MEKTIAVASVAEAFIELLNANGVSYLFLNPGTDTYAIQEAIAKYKTLGKRTPEVILCLHESIAMAAAHGHFMVSGKPQVILVHADLGPLQVGGALHNAQRGRIGVVLCSGQVPSNTEGRLNQVHWLQDQYDQAGAVRGYVKWEYMLRSPDNVHEVVQRAFQMASSEPYGPVYLSLPLDILGQKLDKLSFPDVNRHSAVSTPQADNEVLEEAAEVLVTAKNPLIITGYSGRHTRSVASLVDLAESLSARVVTSQALMNFPTIHPLYGGFDCSPYIENADAVLIIDEDVPYIPAQTRPRVEAKIIHIDIDPLKQNMPLWGFPADFLIQADSSKVLPVLTDMIRDKITPEKQAFFEARFQKISEEDRQMQDKWRLMAVSTAAQRPISAEWLCHCVGEVIDADTLVLGETVTNRQALLRQLPRYQPGTIFHSGGSNLGWGLGAALGAKLARPDRTVVTLVGDGSFVFGCPTAALWASAAYQAPFLCVIFNNNQYTAPRLVLRQSLGPGSYSEKFGLWVGTNLKPAPDYTGIARSCGAYGQTVEDPADLHKSLKIGLEHVNCGKTAIIDVRIASIL
jgi:acetolactate synthase I/II/III large subunit